MQPGVQEPVICGGRRRPHKPPYTSKKDHVCSQVSQSLLVVLWGGRRRGPPRTAHQSYTIVLGGRSSATTSPRIHQKKTMYAARCPGAYYLWGKKEAGQAPVYIKKGPCNPGARYLWGKKEAGTAKNRALYTRSKPPYTLKKDHVCSQVCRSLLFVWEEGGRTTTRTHQKRIMFAARCPRAYYLWGRRRLGPPRTAHQSYTIVLG